MIAERGRGAVSFSNEEKVYSCVMWEVGLLGRRESSGSNNEEQRKVPPAPLGCLHEQRKKKSTLKGSRFQLKKKKKKKEKKSSKQRLGESGIFQMTGWKVRDHSGKFSADWEGDVKEDKQGCLRITVGDGEPWGFMQLVEARTVAGMLVLRRSCWQS